MISSLGLLQITIIAVLFLRHVGICNIAIYTGNVSVEFRIFIIGMYSD